MGTIEADEKSLFKLGYVEKQYEVHWEIEIDVSVNAPQALLRDLHRPENYFQVNPLEVVRQEIVLDGGRTDVNRVKQILYRDYRLPIWNMVPTRQMLRDGWQDVRHKHEMSWDTALEAVPQRDPGERAPQWAVFR